MTMTMTMTQKKNEHKSIINNKMVETTIEILT